MLMQSTKDVHRDINPYNILLSGDDIESVVAKLGDFGWERDLTDETLFKPSFYLSPERIKY